MTRRQCVHCSNIELYTAFEYTHNECVIAKCKKADIVKSVSGKSCPEYDPHES